jgi:hypothetical protein
MEGVFHYLAAVYDDPELDWKVRHRDNADRMIAGGVLGIAEVVKGLHALSRIRPLPTKEREQYDNARHLLVHEVAVSLAVPPALAEDYIDYALMPPAGVTFKLKPPPKPVELPSRPRRRPTRTTEEDDLGLDELGLDLGDEEIVPAAAAEGEEGAAPVADALAIPTPEDMPEPEGEAEGEGAEALAPAGDEDEDEGEGDEGEEPETRKAPAKKTGAKEKAPASPAKKATKPKAEKTEKAEKPAPAKKPAAKKPAAKPKAEKAEKKAPAKGKKK